jgi:uncharacterized protein (DUF433 family)
MQLEDYLVFERFPTKFGEAERIRIKGHRIAIENVIEYFNQGMTAEQIQRECYPALTLAEVYATITYYLINKQEVEAYLERGKRIEEGFYKEYQDRGPYFLRDDALNGRPPQTGQPGSPDVGASQVLRS